MALIKWLKDISAAQSEELGSKAALLGAVMNMGWHVPIGFVMTPEFFERFLIVTNIESKISNLLSVMNYADDERLQTVANEIQKLIIETAMPSGLASQLGEYYDSLTVRREETSQTLLSARADVRVAVRTSTTMPEPDSPGTFGMYMNLQGKDKVCRAVQACWASRFTLKVLKMLHAKGDVDPRMAIIVQKMIMPTSSGEVYTKDNRASEGEIVIDAYWGFREVSEEDIENADTYYTRDNDITRTEVRNKKIEFAKDIDTGNIIKVDLTPKKSQSQVLDDVQVREIAAMARRVRKQLNREQQITWAYVKENLYLLQAVSLPSEGKEMDIEHGEADKILKESEEKDVITSAVDEHTEKYGTDESEIIDSDIENEIESEDFGPPASSQEPPPPTEESAKPEEEEESSIIQTYRDQTEEETAAEPEPIVPEATPEWKSAKNPEELLENAYSMAGHVVGDALRAVTLKLREKYAELYQKVPPTQLAELITALQQEITVPYADELLDIYASYIDFMTNYERLNSNVVEKALRICSKTISEL